MLGAWGRALKSRNCTPDTLYTYGRVSRVFVTYLAERELTLETCRAVDILLWLDTMRLGPKSRYSYIAVLASLYGWLIREELLEHDPTVRVDRPKLGTYLPRPAPAETVELALAQLDPRSVAMIACGTYAGMRRAEITRLRVEDLYTKRRPPVVLIHGKGNKERLVPIHPALMGALRRCGLPRTGYVFPNSRTGQAMTVRYVGKLISNAFDSLGDRVTPHQLRHLFATLLYEESKGDLRLVADMLGHSNLSATTIYAKLSQKRAGRLVQRLTLEPTPDEPEEPEEPTAA